MSFVDSQRTNIDLGQIWRCLVEGELRLVESEYGAGRCFATFEDFRRGRERDVAAVCMLRGLLRGEPLKVVADEFGLAQSTVCHRCIGVLTRFGAGGSVSRTPIIVVMAALCAEGASVPEVRFEGFTAESRWRVSAAFPADSLRARLTPSEFDVASLALEGHSHAEISRSRRRSPRTIANQMASIFRKFAVSGRGELRVKVIHEAASA